MLTRAARLCQYALLSLVVYDAALSLSGWTAPDPAPRGRRRRRFRVVVPAHDEAHVVAGVVGDVLDQEYPDDLVRLCVLADGCTDDTAAAARRAGAEVVEHPVGSGSKGALLAWHLAREPLAPDEALVVLDADTRVDRRLLGRFADELDAGADALQANLDVLDPRSSWLSSAAALSYWSGNRMVQLARSTRGWSSDLGGTGMCLSHDALEAAGGFGGSLSEDRELALRLILRGRRVRWLHDVRVWDEKPDDVDVVVRQRARWRTGLDQVRRTYLLPLARCAVRDRSPAAADHALRLVRPSRATLVLASTALAAAPRGVGAALLPRAAWRTALAVQLLLPPVFLRRDGLPWTLVLRYPLVVALSVVAVPARVLSSRRPQTWIHTPHKGKAIGSAADGGR